MSNVFFWRWLWLAIALLPLERWAYHFLTATEKCRWNDGNFHRQVHYLLLKMVKNFYSGNNMSVEISIDMWSFFSKMCPKFPNHFLDRDKCRRKFSPTVQEKYATQNYNLSKTIRLLSACEGYGKSKAFFTFISGALRIQYRPSSN